MESGGKLTPILREGIEIIKVIFFKELRDHIRLTRPEWADDFVAKATGAVVNEVFGVGHQSGADFVAANRQEIDGIKATVGEALPALRIPLTDALRTMVLCDYQECGRDTSLVLEQARDLGILLTERDLPLPNHFIDLVRRLGTAKGILQAMPAS